MVRTREKDYGQSSRIILHSLLFTSSLPAISRFLQPTPSPACSPSKNSPPFKESAYFIDSSGDKTPCPTTSALIDAPTHVTHYRGITLDFFTMEDLNRHATAEDFHMSSLSAYAIDLK